MGIMIGRDVVTTLLHKLLPNPYLYMHNSVSLCLNPDTINVNQDMNS